MSGIKEFILPALTLLLTAVAVAVLLSQRKEIAGLKNKLRANEQSLEEARRDLRETKEDLSVSLGETRRELSQTVGQSLNAISTSLANNNLQTEQRLEYLKGTIEQRLSSIQKDNNEQLERMRATVDEKLEKTLNDRLSQSFDTVRKSLDSVMTGLGEMKEVAGSVSDLKKVLSNVKTRGILGEYQLKAILGEILSREQYEENCETVPGSGKRVEFAIRMPGDGNVPVYLPVDSKFPADTYSFLLESYDSGDPAKIEDARKQLASRIRGEAKDISEKYIETPYTTDFGVLFLPFEGLYSEAVNLGMMEILQSEYRVVMAGPSTMAAFLNSIQMGFKTLAIQKNAGEAWKVLGKVKSEFDKFDALLAKARKKLTEADDVMEELSGRRTRAIQRSLRDVQVLELGDGAPDDPEIE